MSWRRVLERKDDEDNDGDDNDDDDENDDDDDDTHTHKTVRAPVISTLQRRGT